MPQVCIVCGVALDSTEHAIRHLTEALIVEDIAVAVTRKIAADADTTPSIDELDHRMRRRHGDRE